MQLMVAKYVSHPLFGTHNKIRIQHKANMYSKMRVDAIDILEGLFVFVGRFIFSTISAYLYMYSKLFSLQFN